MESIKEKAGNIVKEAEKNLKRDYMKTADHVIDAANEVKSSADETFKAVQQFCRNNPGIAMGVSVGVGALVGIVVLKVLSDEKSANEKMISDLFRKGERMWDEVRHRVEPAVKGIKESVGI
jgi:ElaB/YqjD/DUF883 family membrane-anchored ribosome-binding protein